VASSPFYSSLHRWRLSHFLPPCTDGIFPILFLSSQGVTSHFSSSLPLSTVSFSPSI
jgi:hypothetical protein